MHALAKAAQQAAKQGTQKAAQQTVRAGAAVSQERDISTLIKSNVADGQRQTPGHVQLKTTTEEQQEFGVAEAYGHSPAGGAPRTRTPVSGKLNDGTDFSVQGITTKAKPLGEDTPRSEKGATVFDHGKLTAAEAEILKNMEFEPMYETSGKERANCVHGYQEIINKLSGTNDKVPDHTLPQEMAPVAEKFTQYKQQQANAALAAAKPPKAPGGRGLG